MNSLQGGDASRPLPRAGQLPCVALLCKSPSQSLVAFLRGCLVCREGHLATSVPLALLPVALALMAVLNLAGVAVVLCSSFCCTVLTSWDSSKAAWLRASTALLSCSSPPCSILLGS